MNAAEAWKQIDDDKKMMLYTREDAIITDRGGLFRAVDRKGKSNIIEISLPVQSVDNNHLASIHDFTPRHLFKQDYTDFDPYSIHKNQPYEGEEYWNAGVIFKRFVKKIKDKALASTTEQQESVREEAQGNGVRRTLESHPPSISTSIQCAATKANNHVR